MAAESIHRQSFLVPSLPIHSVTIYPSCAAIVRDVANVTILPGRNEITLHGLTPNAEKHSIKVECRDTAGLVTEMAVDLVPYDEDVGGEDLSLNVSIEKGEKLTAPLADKHAPHLHPRSRIARETLYSRVAEAPQPPPDAARKEPSKIRKNMDDLNAEGERLRAYIAERKAREAESERKLAEATISKSQTAAYKAPEVRKRDPESTRSEPQGVKVQTPKDVYRVRITIELEPPPKRATSGAAAATAGRPERAKVVEVPAGNGGGPSLRVSYVTSGAFWTPRYDVRLDTLANTGVLTYRAHFLNHTGETWGGARITLSTSPTSFSGPEDKAPRMGSWRISLSSNRSGNESNDRDGSLYSAKERELQDERKRKRLIGRPAEEREYQEHDDPYGGDSDEGSATTAHTAVSNSLGITTPTAEFFGLTTAYDLPGTRTVISSTQVSRRIIAEHKLTDITYTHHSVPKLRPSVFLKARIRNPSATALLRGLAGLSLDGCFLGTTTIPLCGPGDRFKLGLGVDESVLVEYRRPTRAVELRSMVAGEQVFTYGRCISIYNTRKSDITLLVSDQVPVSEDKGLEVRMRKPSALRVGRFAGGTAAGIVVVSEDKKAAEGLADAGAAVDDDGLVVWRAKVKGGTRIRIGLVYEVKMPTGANIGIYEG